MRDILLVIILMAFVLTSLRVPYFMALGYLWVDFLQPQRMGYYLFNQIPVAMILGAGAFGFYLLFDRERRPRIDIMQVLVFLLVAYATMVTFSWAEVDGSGKWDWVSKALLFSVFLPFVLTTRVRIEAALAVIIFSVSAITVSGGLKTLLGGGGYGTLSLLTSASVGLYESSTLAASCCAMIPLVWWFYRHNSLVPANKLTLLLTLGIIASFLLVIVGSEARTGLLALGVLALMIWWGSRRKVLIAGGMLLALIVALPFMPQSFLDRMSTIQNFEADQSAATRLAVWEWTLEYVGGNPLGGGFDVYKINNVSVTLQETTGTEGNQNTTVNVVTDRARAFHSSYFEVLGELGIPGFTIWTLIILLFYFSARKMARFDRPGRGEEVPTAREIRATDVSAEWAGSFGRAMSQFLPVYMVGALFIGIAFNAVFYDLLAIFVSVKGAAAVGFNQYAAKAKQPQRRWVRPRGASPHSA